MGQLECQTYNGCSIDAQEEMVFWELSSGRIQPLEDDGQQNAQGVCSYPLKAMASSSLVLGRQWVESAVSSNLVVGRAGRQGSSLRQKVVLQTYEGLASKVSCRV